MACRCRRRARHAIRVRRLDRTGSARRPARGRGAPAAALGAATGRPRARVRERHAPARRPRRCSRGSTACSQPQALDRLRRRRGARRAGRRARERRARLRCGRPRSADGGEAHVPRSRWRDDGAERRLDGLPQLDGASGVDPAHRPVHASRRGGARPSWRRGAPAVPVLGGLASGRTPTGRSALFIDDEVLRRRRRRRAAAMASRCSRACRRAPRRSGREVTITAAEGNVIHELAGRPALDTVEQIIAELAPRERALMAEGLLIGIVIDERQARVRAGRLPRARRARRRPRIRRGSSSAPRSERARSSACTRATRSPPTRISAARCACASRRYAGEPPAGALVFSCNGRGRAMFGTP